MKKIKVMLMSVLVVAAIGGAFAFKATKGQTLFCGTVAPPTNNCPIQTNAYKIQSGTPVPNIWCSTVINGNCTTVVTD